MHTWTRALCGGLLAQVRNAASERGRRPLLAGIVLSHFDGVGPSSQNAVDGVHAHCHLGLIPRASREGAADGFLARVSLARVARVAAAEERIRLWYFSSGVSHFFSRSRDVGRTRHKNSAKLFTPGHPKEFIMTRCLKRLCVGDKVRADLGEGSFPSTLQLGAWRECAFCGEIRTHSDGDEWLWRYGHPGPNVKLSLPVRGFSVRILSTSDSSCQRPRYSWRSMPNKVVRESYITFVQRIVQVASHQVVGWIERANQVSAYQARLC